MRGISDLIKPDDPQSSIGLDVPMKSENELEAVKYQERVWDKLWQRLTEIYGHKLHSQYGETIPEAWEMLLKDITPEQIKQGLNELVERKDAWPPTGTEFRQLCLPKTISPDGTNSDAYKLYEPAKRIIDEGYVSKRKKAGKRELGAMKDLFK